MSKTPEKQGQAEMTIVGGKTSDTALKAGSDHRCGAPEASQAVSRRSASGFPVTIAEWPRTGDELVRVRINRFNNSFTLDIRCWVREGRVFRPRRNGLTLGVKHLTSLVHALAQALDRAELWGLIDPVVVPKPERKTPQITARPRRSHRRPMMI